MKILQLLHKPKSMVAQEMWYKSELYYKKFYNTVGVRYDERFNKIKPYMMDYIEKLNDEIEFLDLYFKQNDKFPAMWWWNIITRKRNNDE